MKVRPLLVHSLVFSVAVLLGGCTIHLGPLDESDEVEPREPSILPGPEQPQGEEEVLDEAQQARKDEADRYVAQVIYQGAPIVRTIQLQSGDIIDGIDRDRLPRLPYELPQLPGTPGELPSGEELGLMDVDQIPELAELVATTAPFYRPTFWPYILGETDTTSIEDYLDRFQVGGAPSGEAHLYAGLVSSEPNRGVSGFMNQFRPEVAPGSFSLLEFAVACPADGPVEEMIGVVISADKVNGFGKNGKALTDGEPRMHVEYARSKDGQVKYTWDGLDGQFVPNPFRRYRPGQIVPVSEPGGTQVEHLLSIFQTPTGDWWLAYQHDLLGYYPASLFTMLNGGACWSAWYGEVARLGPAPGYENANGAIKTTMGTGRPADAGPQHAASIRNPLYYDPLWFGVEPDDDESLWMTPYKPTCYSRSRRLNGTFYLGGSGGEEPGCQWPSP
jgi:Neprosin